LREIARNMGISEARPLISRGVDGRLISHFIDNKIAKVFAAGSRRRYPCWAD